MSQRGPGDICNQADQDGINLRRCMQGYEDAVNTVLSAAYSQGYQMGLRDLKNRIHQLGVDVCNQADIEGKSELQCIKGYNDEFN